MGNCWSRFRMMGSCLPIFVTSVDSLRPPSMDVIQTTREMYQKIDPVEQIDRLISFLENQLQKMKRPSETGSSSLEGWLTTVQDSTKLAAKTIDIISTEAEKLSDTEDALEKRLSLMLTIMEGMEEIHWLFIGLSVAAFAVESFISVGSSDNKWTELLVNVLELAKHVKEYNEQMPNEREQLLNAVGTIVEGAFLCCDYFQKQFGFWSATTAAAQLRKNNKQLRHVKDSLALDSLYQHWYKDVFLSHSGAQKNFVRQLHRDLTSKHVSCFFDEDRNSLPLGEKFPQLILKAAESCKIAVVLLSQEFVRSKWPMIELSAFIRASNSGKNANFKILPIFYKISPNELKDIAKVTPQWQKVEVSNDTIGEWQDALKVVRSYNGLNFGEDGDEVAFRERIVEEIRFLLGGIKPPLLLEVKPVGIENQVREVKALLDMKGTESALAVIVYGFGGAGKSTLAASVVQSLDWFSMDCRFCKSKRQS